MALTFLGDAELCVRADRRGDVAFKPTAAGRRQLNTALVAQLVERRSSGCAAGSWSWRFARCPALVVPSAHARARSIPWREIGLALPCRDRFRLAQRAALASFGHPRYSRSVLLAAAVPVSYKSEIQVLSSRRAANCVSKPTAEERLQSFRPLSCSGGLTRR